MQTLPLLHIPQDGFHSVVEYHHRARQVLSRKDMLVDGNDMLKCMAFHHAIGFKEDTRPSTIRALEAARDILSGTYQNCLSQGAGYTKHDIALKYCAFAAWENRYFGGSMSPADSIAHVIAAHYID